jgi:DMSO/TMAO reductase YedYZ molybdopterin-dependent catalytic subunit
MTLRPKRRLSRIGVLVGVCALIAGTNIAAQSGAPSPAQLTVGGSVANPATYSVDDLKRLPVREFEDVRQIRAEGAIVGRGEQIRRYRGVLLRDVLSAAGPLENERHDLRRSVVVATATDGYKAVFSWAELFLSPIGDGVLVILERDGDALPVTEGPLALLSLRDTKPGPRHVKWLAKVEIFRLRE